MNTPPNVIYQFASCRLDPVERRFWRDGQELNLRSKVFDLLVIFIESQGHKLSNRELLEKGWPEVEVEDNTLTVTINELRKVIGKECIQNIPKHGYRFTAEVITLVANNPKPRLTPIIAEPPAPQPPGGAVPLNSDFYITRQTDGEFFSALDRHDSIVLVKGARQTGKTSLLARGLQRMREADAQVVITDFQQLPETAFKSVENLLLTLAESIADQLSLDRLPHETWNHLLTPANNFVRYLRREVLANETLPLVWGMDEVDLLFNYLYADEVFGLFRSWHNQRALDPSGPWHRLTLAMAYATEANLFLTDLNQSPFNVGTRLVLEDFTPQQVATLNQRYGAPLKNDRELERYFALVGGHPYLVQCGLHEMAGRKTDISSIEAQADQDEGLFGNHLRRIVDSLERDAALCDAMRNWLRNKSKLSLKQFFRLRSAGLLMGDSQNEAKARCGIYAQYLRKRLGNP